MDLQSINRATILLGAKIPIANFPYLNEILTRTEIPEQDLTMIAFQMKDPTISLILSILVGSLGVDRFYLGDIVLGILKLITCGGMGIWWLVDIFLIMGITRDHNWNLLMTSLQNYPQSREVGTASYPEND